MGARGLDADVDAPEDAGVVVVRGVPAGGRWWAVGW